MERAKFRWLRYASLLAFGVSTLSLAAAGERHRVWVDPPSDLMAQAAPEQAATEQAAPDNGSEPPADRSPAEPLSTKMTSSDPIGESKPASSKDQPSQTGSLTGPDADPAIAAKAPDGGSGSGPDERTAEPADAAKQHETRTANREDPAIAEPAPVRRTSVDRERPRAAPRHSARKAHRSIRRSAGRTPLIQRIFGPPRRGTNVITTGSIR